MGKTKLNIPMFAALILLLLTMVTTHISSGLYARYTTSATAVSSARVAKFNINCTVENVENKADEYTMTIFNDSEVAVTYSIIVEMDKHLSATIGIGTETIEGTETINGNKKSVSFTQAHWSLAPNSSADPLTLTLTITDWTGLTNPEGTPTPTESVSLGFQVKVAAEQID